MSTQKMIANDQIDAQQVRVINSDGSQAGIINTREAVLKAKNQKLDLVLVAANANPPVCKIMDFGKAQYDAKKKAKASKAKQTTIQIKEIQLRPVTDTGDLTRKINDARKFLEKGNKVRFQMRFRGREASHSEIGMKMMQQILVDLASEITVEKQPVMNGRNILMVLAPV